MASSDEQDDVMEIEEGEEEDDEQAEERIDDDGEIDYHPPAEEEDIAIDESAYIMYHEASAGAPCLSFDIIPDQLGDKREDFPMTCYAASGTQAARGRRNYIVVMKMSNLQRTSIKKEKKEENENEDDDEDSSSDEEDDTLGERKPNMEMAAVSHAGGVNRIRCTVVQDSSYLAATWSDMGKVNIFDLKAPLGAVNDSEAMEEYDYEKRQDSSPPIFSSAHTEEGFALDWSRLSPGTLVAGNCAKDIHIFSPQEDGSWQSQGPYVGHTASVEDLQWSPTEKSVFVSCSVDHTIRIWDNRASPKKACMITIPDAHLNDVNVIHWNHLENHILLSGGDDNDIKIWDLRQFKQNQATPIGTCSFHKGPITSVEWNPNDSTVFAASGEDDMVTLWDLSLEQDDVPLGTRVDASLPQQLLFTHHGQKEVKEVHWHPQLPGVVMTTAHSGINIFKTIST